MQELEELLCQLAAPMNSVVTTVVDQARGTLNSLFHCSYVSVYLCKVLTLHWSLKLANLEMKSLVYLETLKI